MLDQMKRPLPQQRKRKWAWGILAVTSASMLWMAWFIDDWSRDFTTNTAVTDPAATNPEMRPLVSDRSPQQVAEAVKQWVATTPQWQLESSEATDEGQRLHLTRRTRLFHFTDDIHVVIVRDSETQQTTLSVHSQSRIGKGDLGQNPRNIQQLIRGVRKVVVRSANATSPNSPEFG